MIRAVSLLALIGFAAPAFGQDLNPALEGEGTQTQSVELLDGAVSVSVESSGSLSLGGGAPDASGSLGVSVNDRNLGLAGDDAAGQAGQAGQAGAAAGRGARSAEIPAGDAQRASAGTACSGMQSSAELLDEAIENGARVWLRPVECRTRAEDVTELMDSQPGLAEAIAEAGIGSEAVVAITVSDGLVIVEHNSKR